MLPSNACRRAPGWRYHAAPFRKASLLTAQRPSTLRLALILGALSAIAPLSIDMYLPAMPALEAELDASRAAIQQSLSAYLLGMASGQMLHGPLSDRYGRKGPLAVALALYALAALGCALATGPASLVFMRVLQGLAGSVGAVLSRAVARDCHEGPELVRILSLVMLVSGVAPILAPLLGGWTLLIGSWRLIFLAQVAFGVALVIAVLWGLPETHPPASRTRGGFGSFLGGLASILRNREFLAYGLPFGLAAGQLFTYIVSSPFVFVTHFHVPEHAFGWFFGANAVCIIGGSQICSRLVRRWPADKVLRVVVCGQALAALCLLGVAAAGGGLWATLACTMVVVGGVGFCFPVGTAGALMPFPKLAGSASAVLGLMHGMAGMIGTAIVGHVPGAGALPMAWVVAGFALLSMLSLALNPAPASKR